MATKWIAVNGPNHGTDITSAVELEDGNTINVEVVGSMHSYGDDVDIRFTHPKFEQTYFLLGRYAYYVGEELLKREF